MQRELKTIIKRRDFWKRFEEWKRSSKEEITGGSQDAQQSKDTQPTGNLTEHKEIGPLLWKEGWQCFRSESWS